MTDIKNDDALADFDKREMTLNNITKSVYVSGEGPAVIVLAEMPGISPHLARFARWVREAGFTVYMPSLFGKDGAVPGAKEGAEVFQRACINAEFRAFAKGGSSPVTEWLRALARSAHNEVGGPGVGAIGMCFTGNFALSMMLEPSMLAPVLAQPSLPLDAPNSVESPDEELAMIRERLENEDLTVLAYRFEGDQVCQAGRFAKYQEALGECFVPRVLSDEAANTEVPPFFQKYVPTPHSVFTAHLIDRSGEPTLKAVDEVLEFFRKRLSPSAG